MRIGGIGGPASYPRRMVGDAREPQPAEAETRALIAVEAAAATERSHVPTRHPSAPFLAHLIATKMHAPQTRARRRAAPDEAAAAYLASPPRHSRTTFRRDA